ncbi:MAG: Response regulator receiver protein [uncultured bacterium]|nr:MAG: Response regulator receiver protein [uncultured bacterium]
MEDKLSNKKKILIIDDEDDYRQTLMDRLIFEGFEVIEALNGVSGIEMAEEAKPDLILLDLMMPVMNGYSCWANLRKDAFLKSIPVLILTAKMHAHDVFWGSSLPERDYINKSISLNQLLRRIYEKMAESDDAKRLSAEIL